MRSLVKSAQTQNTQSLGRLTEADELSIAPSLQNYPPIQIVLQRCVDCLSVLMQAALIPKSRSVLVCVRSWQVSHHPFLGVF